MSREPRKLEKSKVNPFSFPIVRAMLIFLAVETYILAHVVINWGPFISTELAKVCNQ